MSFKSDTWMPFYVGDYLSATGRLTTEQHGAYLLILLDYWKNGPPPNDDAVLAQIARMSPQAWRKSKSALLGFFDVSGGHLVQKRVEKERERASEITDERSKAGKAGAAKRWQGHKQKHGKRMANAIDLPLANGQQNDGPSQSQSQEGSEPNGSSPRAWACPPGVDPSHWRDFLKNRRTKRLTNTETAYQGQLKALADLSDDEWPPGMLVKHAAENGWAAIHDPRDNRYGPSTASNTRQDRPSSWGTARTAVMGHVGTS